MQEIPRAMPALAAGLLTPSERPAVVLDCGTGYTKLGFSGNSEASGDCPPARPYIKMEGNTALT